MLRRIGCLALLIAIAVPGYARADPVAEWRKQVATSLSNNKRYPPKAMGQTGNVKVGFIVDRTGNLVSSWLEESAGIPALDEEALRIVERAQPFPIPPPELNDGQLRLAIPFVFSNRPPPGYLNFDQEQAALSAKMRSICRGC